MSVLKEYSFLINQLLYHLKNRKEKNIFSSHENYLFLKDVLKDLVQDTPTPTPIKTKTVPLPQSNQKKTPPTISKNSPPPPPKETIETVKNFSFFEDFREIVNRISPQIKISNQLPDDTTAKKIATGYIYKQNVEDILILSASEDKKELVFLENIAKAVLTLFFPSSVLKIPQLDNLEWSSLLSLTKIKLIIANRDEILNTPDLLPFFKENNSPQKAFLKDKPLFFIQKPSSYLITPLLKSKLWKELKTTLEDLTK